MGGWLALLGRCEVPPPMLPSPRWGKAQMSKDDPHVSRVRSAGDRRKPKPGRTREETKFAQHLRRTASRTEDKLWPHLRAEQMGAPFRRQHVVDRAFPDYCCVPLRLIVEVDGPLHDLEHVATFVNRKGIPFWSEA